MAGQMTYHCDSGRDSPLVPKSAQTADAKGAGSGWRLVASGLWLGPRRRRMVGGAVAACVWLAGCGGGGGGASSDAGAQAVADPPSTGATLATTSTEAQAATPAALSAAETTAARVAEVKGIPLFGLGSAFGQSADESDLKTIQSEGSPSMKPLAVETGTCTDLGMNTGCSGTVTIDYTVNLLATSATAHAGEYADATFSSISGTIAGLRMSLNGRFRLDFLSDWSGTSTNLRGLDVQVTMTNFSGAINGVSFGPTSALGRLTVNNQGTITYTTGGARYSGLSGVRFTSSGNYAVGGGTARVAYWNDSSRYVDVTFQNWTVSNNRPGVGSKVTVTGGSGSLVITVTATTTNTVVYSVNITSGSAVTRYTVTATYPSGGGAPSYVAVAS